MTVRTSKGKTFEIEWMWGPVGLTNDLMLQMKDDRFLSDIAKDFEGCDHFHRESELEGDMDWEGYTVLRGIFRPEQNSDDVQITLSKPNSAS